MILLTNVLIAAEYVTIVNVHTSNISSQQVSTTSSGSLQISQGMYVCMYYYIILCIIINFYYDHYTTVLGTTPTYSIYDCSTVFHPIFETSIYLTPFTNSLIIQI